MSVIFETFNAGVSASLNANRLRAAGEFDEAAKFEQQAIEHFDQALELDPRHSGALGGKAMSLAMLGQPSDAVLAFEAAIEVEPNHEFYRQLGLCHVELGDMEKAWIVTRKAIEIDDSAEFRAQASTELLGFGNHVLHIAATNQESMNQEQLIAYHQWAASIFALACDTDPDNSDARSLLSSTEAAIADLSNS